MTSALYETSVSARVKVRNRCDTSRYKSRSIVARMACRPSEGGKRSGVNPELPHNRAVAGNRFTCINAAPDPSMLA